MTNNNQQPPQENPNNQFSNNEPMTFAQKVEYVKSTEMTNNKQQTEINAVEYLGKVNQFAKENNTDKPRQQTAIEWFSQQVLDNWNDIDAGARDIIEFFKEAKEMEKDQHIKSWEAGLMKVDFNEYYEQTYGGGEQ
jgi:hypothetical protein